MNNQDDQASGEHNVVDFTKAKTKTDRVLALLKELAIYVDDDGIRVYLDEEHDEVIRVDTVEFIAIVKARYAAAHDGETVSTASVRSALDALGDALPSTDQAAPEQKERTKRPSQADVLVQLAQAKCELFHDDYDDSFATLIESGHRETYKLRSTKFRSWLDKEYFVAYQKAPGGQAKADAIAVLEGLALHDRPKDRVYVRYAEVGGAVFVDLCNAAREIVRVDARGWELVASAPVRFVRPKGMLPLPRPERGGSVDELRPFVNVDEDWKFVLFVSWIVAAMKPRGPFPVLALVAEHGGAKSTCSRIARAFVDPNVSPIRSVPREVRDLAVAAKAGHVLAYDNLSGVQPWLSDALCRVATGGGFSTRGLYTNDEEVIFDFIRPIIVNGIDNVAERADLADRCLLLSLPPIPKSKRRREKALWHALEAKAPRIFGALLSGLVGALRNEDNVEPAELPRMADFATFAVAAETALGFSDGAFMQAFARSAERAVEAAIDADAIASAVLGLVGGCGTWTGTTGELLDALTERASDAVRKSPEWPKRPNVLSNRLRRAAPFLRTVGVGVEQTRSMTGSRVVLTHLEEWGQPSSSSSSSSSPAKNKGFEHDDPPQKDRHGDRHRSSSPGSSGPGGVGAASAARRPSPSAGRMTIHDDLHDDLFLGDRHHGAAKNKPHDDDDDHDDVSPLSSGAPDIARAPIPAAADVIDILGGKKP